ncbi:MAG: hypothetical protein R3C99_11845 [Pirellulaceae bacterium]
MRNLTKKLIVAILCVGSLMVAELTFAQRVRLPSVTAGYQGDVTTQPYVPPTGSTLAPVPQPNAGVMGGATLQAPGFDPYASQNAAGVAPSLLGSPPQPGYYGGSVPGMPPAPGYGAAGTYPYGGYPTTQFPTTPPALFPNGTSLWGPNAAGNAPPWGPPLRLFYGPRIRHTWLPDGEGLNDLEWNKSDISFAIAFPNFLYSSQPLYVLPSFTLDLWEGPRNPGAPFDPGPPATPAVPPSDLPARAYEAFVDFGWQSDPNQILGVDLGFRIGVWTDFDTLNNDSLRLLGKGLVKYHVTPAVTLKAGVLYVDRLKVKLIPAGGILWEPNPQMRFDIYFPEPKISTYFTTLGNYEIWTYLAGEYGGGSWTIERVSGMSDQIDINDIRVIAGIEWARPDMIRQGRRIGFIEAGYVFERELLYRNTPASNLDLGETLMVRAGIGY